MCASDEQSNVFTLPYETTHGLLNDFGLSALVDCIYANVKARNFGHVFDEDLKKFAGFNATGLLRIGSFRILC
jgi:hypothetical protein